MFDDTLDLLLETHKIKLKGVSVVLVAEVTPSDETDVIIDDKKRKRENNDEEIEQIEMDVINHVKGIHLHVSTLVVGHLLTITRVKVKVEISRKDPMK